MSAGIVLTLIGLVLTFWMGRRAFFRRNEAGIEEFSGYGRRLATHAGERVVLIIGRILTLLGVVIVGLHWMFHS